MTGRAQCCGFAPAFSNSAGQDGPLLYPGPLCGGEWGRQAAERASAWMPMPFRQHMDVLSKSPAPARGLSGQEARKARKRGGLSLWLSFSLATQRESNSAAEGRRKLLL